MKKFISLVLCVLLVVGVFAAMPISAGATISGDWEYDYYYYDGVIEKLWITNYVGSSSSITIPATIDGQPVYAIGDGFRSNTALTSVTISEGVEYIGACAFKDCSNLSYVSLPDSLDAISYDAFAGTDFVNNYANYEGGALYAGKHLIRVKEDYSGDITVKKGTLSMANDAFEGCSNVTNITIPNSIKNLSYGVFEDCNNLNTLILGEGITAIDGPIKCVNLVVPTTVYTIGYGILEQPNGVQNVYFCRLREETSVWEMIYMSSTNIPHGHSTIWVDSYLDEVNIYHGYTPKGRHRVIFKKSGDGAEPYSQVVEDGETATDPSNIWGVYDYEIVGSRWKPIEGYPTYYKDLEYYSDKACTVPYDFDTPVTSDLTIYCKDKDSTDPIVYSGYVYIDGAVNWKYAVDTCTFIVERTNIFSYDDSFEEYLWEAKHLVVKDSVNGIGEAIMLNSEQLETVEIAGSVKEIGDDCFQNCEKLRSVTLNEGLETIGWGAFCDLPMLEELTIPSTVKTIMGISDLPKLRSITIPNGVEKIDKWALCDLPLVTSIKLPDSLTYIGDGTIMDIPNMKSITVPSSVTYIGEKSLGYVYSSESGGYVPMEGFTICGAKGSAAETYAKANGFRFIVSGSDEPAPVEKTDSETGIKAEIAADTELVVSTVDKGSIKLIVGGEIAAAYDIKLTKDGSNVQPDGSVTVSIPCSDPAAKVYRVEADNSLTDMNAVYKDGYLVFSADHFSLYIVTAPKSGGGESYLLGDSDADGEVTVLDATAIQRHLVGLPTSAFDEIAANADGDTELSVLDATSIQRWLVGLSANADIGKKFTK